MSEYLDINKFVEKANERQCIVMSALATAKVNNITEITSPADIDLLCNTQSYATLPEIAKFMANNINLQVIDGRVLKAKVAYRTSLVEDFV